MKKTIIFLLLIISLSLCGCSSAPNPVTSPDTESPIVSETIRESVKPELSTQEPSTENFSVPTQLSIEDVCRAGQINATTYTNDILGFTATLPEGWQFATEQEIDNLFDQTQNSAISQAPSRDAYLFFCSKSGLTSNKDENSVISVFISYSNGLALTMPQANFERYLQSNLAAFQEALPDIDINLNGEQDYLFGDKSYTVIYRECKDGRLIYNQDAYISELGDFMIVFSPNYIQDDKEAIHEMMSHLKYTK